MTSGTSDTSVGSTFRVRLLGPFLLERNGKPLATNKWQRRVASLFKLLVLAPNQRRLRDEVIDLFWPDADPTSAAVSLRVTAYRLRLALGRGEPSPVLLEQGWVALNPSSLWQVDVHDFEVRAHMAGLNLAALQETLALWRGEPLPDERYEDWAMPIRDRLQRLWRELSLQLAQATASEGEFARAEACLDSVLNLDPLDEEALRRLLEVLYRAGRRAEALQRYQGFEKWLAEELGVPPSPETMAVVQRLSAEFPQSPPRPALDVRSQPLPIGRVLGTLPEGRVIDREEDLERVLLAADRAAGGDGRVVLVGGDRGVGKTRLAQEVAIRLRDRGFIVGTGRCMQDENTFPLAPFADALAFLPGTELGESKVDLTDLLRGFVAGEGAQRHEMTVLLASAVTAVAERQSVAVLVDDLHRADESTLALLQQLAERAGRCRLFILGTYRDDLTGGDHPLSRAIRSLGQGRMLERMTLRRLSLEDTAALVDALIGDLEAPAEFTEFVYRRTHGNPFFIDRMLQALGERYSLIRQIGMGGMGRVFEAIDGATGDLVAVKIMFARTEADPRALRRFEQEGAILATLHHPNIVAVYGTHLDDFTNAIVMELLAGYPLSALLHDEPLPLPRARYLGSQITAALGCAHERGIVHRDIKPGNIMVLDDGGVKVTDFGIARLVRPAGSLTTTASTGMTIGTPFYMAPEQIEGQRIDGRADIYSLGVVLYQAVTGQLPFTGDDPLTIAFKHVHDAPVPPGALRENIPEDWEALILKALAKNPADRFQTASEMGEALQTLSVEPRSRRVAAGAPVQRLAVPAPVSGHMSPPLEADVSATGNDGELPARRGWGSRLGWASAAAAVALLAGTAAYAITRGQQGGPPRVAASTVQPTRPTASPVPTESARGILPGQFNGPSGVTLDVHGNVYVTDMINQRIQELSPGGQWRQLFPSAATGQTEARLKFPTNAAVRPDGTVLVADYKNARIAVFKPDGTYKSSIQVLKKRDHSPRAISNLTIDRQGTIYATDVSDNQIVKLSPEGKPLEQWGRQRLNSPESVAITPDGTVYVADTNNNRILKYSVNGPRPKYLATLGNGFGSGPGQFNTPKGVAVDRQGKIYVADSENDRIEVFSPQGKYVTSIGRTGGGRGQMVRPDSVAVDARGNVYVADWSNNRVEKFSPRGTLIWETPRG